MGGNGASRFSRLLPAGLCELESWGAWPHPGVAGHFSVFEALWDSLPGSLNLTRCWQCRRLCLDPGDKI